MRIYALTLLTFATLLALGSCVGKMKPDYDPPVVSLHTFKALPLQGMTPSFEIGLTILNPDREQLKVEGIYYTVTIEGYQVLAGVSNDLPTIEPYGREDVTLFAHIDIIGGISFFASLLNDPQESFEFTFNAKLDPGGFAPKVVIQEKGEFTLSNKI